VDVPASDLQAVDGAPFEYAIRAEVGSVMSAFVAYPRWDRSGRAASFSPEILGYLRDTLNFGGLIVTDALIMAGASAAQPVPAATVAAVAAGCDALLYPEDFAGVVTALNRAVGTGIPVARAEDALARYEQAVAVWGGHADQGEPDLAAHAAFGDGLADRAIHLVRGDAPVLRAPLGLALVDDDVGGPYRVGPRDVFQETLQQAGVALARRDSGGGSRIVLVYAEPRSWKGRADLGARSRATLKRLAPGAALVVLAAHPRLAAQIPGRAPIVCCWHGQPLMQRAAARWVTARVR
jgi:beta-glucosidase-like glycosyl hydrolase